MVCAASAAAASQNVSMPPPCIDIDVDSGKACNVSATARLRSVRLRRTVIEVTTVNPIRPPIHIHGGARKAPARTPVPLRATSRITKESTSGTAVEKVSEAEYTRVVTFYGMTMPLNDALGIELLDHIQHRGQFTIYSRIAGARVPQIYGPSGDEP